MVIYALEIVIQYKMANSGLPLVLPLFHGSPSLLHLYINHE
jgi:hypothetical protein